MLTDKIIGYIKTGLENGESRQEIADALLSSGWLETDVLAAFTLITGPTAVAPDPTSTSGDLVTEKKYPITTLWIWKVPITLSALALLLLALGNFYCLYFLASSLFYLISNFLVRANFHFAAQDKFLVIRQGVFSKKQRNLPYGVIQNVMIRQDLFDKLLGLASLAVENASQGGGQAAAQRVKQLKQFGVRSSQQRGEIVGSSDNKVNFPGMNKSDAEMLRSILLQKMEENPVEESGL